MPRPPQKRPKTVKRTLKASKSVIRRLQALPYERAVLDAAEAFVRAFATVDAIVVDYSDPETLSPFFRAVSVAETARRTLFSATDALARFNRK